MGNRGVVVPFQRPVSEALRLLAETGSDEQANVAWNDLVHAALRAWSWRDPETLRALVQSIEHVRPWVDRDWSS